MHLRGSALSIIPFVHHFRILTPKRSPRLVLSFPFKCVLHCMIPLAIAATLRMNAPSKFKFSGFIKFTGRAANRKSNPFRRRFVPPRKNHRVAHLRRCDFTRFYFFFFFFSLSFFFIHIYIYIFLIVCFSLLFFLILILIYLSIIRQIPYVESFESDGSNIAVVDLLIILLSNIGGAFEQAYREDRKLYTFVRSWIKKEKKEKEKTVISQYNKTGVFLNFSFMV